MSETIEELNDDPDPHPIARGLGAGANVGEKTPQAKQGEKRIEYDETGAREPGYELVEEASWWKDLVEPKDILLDRVCNLREHEREEGDSDSEIHRSRGPLARSPNGLALSCTAR